MTSEQKKIRLIKLHGEWFLMFPKQGWASSLFLEFVQNELGQNAAISLKFAQANKHNDFFLVTIPQAQETVLVDALGYILANVGG